MVGGATMMASTPMEQACRDSRCATGKAGWPTCTMSLECPFFGTSERHSLASRMRSWKVRRGHSPVVPLVREGIRVWAVVRSQKRACNVITNNKTSCSTLHINHICWVLRRIFRLEIRTGNGAVRFEPSKGQGYGADLAGRKKLRHGQNRRNERTEQSRKTH